MLLGKDGMGLSGVWEGDPGGRASRSCASRMLLYCCVLCQKTKEIPPWIDEQTVFDQTRPLRRWHDAGRHSSGRSSSRSNLSETLPSLLTNFSSDPSWPPWTCWDPEEGGSLDLDQVGTRYVHCPSSVEGNVTSWVMRIKEVTPRECDHASTATGLQVLP